LKERNTKRKAGDEFGGQKFLFAKLGGYLLGAIIKTHKNETPVYQKG